VCEIRPVSPTTSTSGNSIEPRKEVNHGPRSGLFQKVDLNGPGGGFSGQGGFMLTLLRNCRGERMHQRP
jgi:hypothetical protein